MAKKREQKASEAGRSNQAELFALPKEEPQKTAPAKFRQLAEVALNKPLAPLTYGIPGSLEAQVQPGGLVEVRLRGKKQVGCVVRLLEGEEVQNLLQQIKRMQPVLRQVSPSFQLDEEQLRLAQWIADYYMASWGEALACLSFIGFHDLEPKRHQVWQLQPPAEIPSHIERSDDTHAPLKPPPSLTRRQKQVVQWFQMQPPDRAFTYAELKDALGVSPGVLKKLEESGHLTKTVKTIDVLTNNESTNSVCSDSKSIGDPNSVPLELNKDQQSAHEEIIQQIDSATYATFLLKGVTGSGKTEIYLRALEHAQQQGKAGIVLVPEIALTPQTVARFRARFGNRVGVYHSRHTPHEKLRLYQQIRAGEIDVVVGARSALFAPFQRLGLIIVDEEHEASYKQDSVPRYHARDVAVYRAQQLNAVCLLGSATPSLESTFNAENKKYVGLTLPFRAAGAPLPEVELVDMNEQLREKGKLEHLSFPMRSAIRDSLDRGEQALLLLNRRGYSVFFQCPQCKSALGCPHCDVTLTYHRQHDELLCHLCDYRRTPPRFCDECESEYNRLGLGTQRLEEELERLFPGKKVLRLDRDTTNAKEAWDEHWRAMEHGEVDLIMGTQMIAKGLHLEKVTCVGVVQADITLNQPDYRADERTFSLITQVAGRAGRGDRPGKVVIQTFRPDRYAVRLAAQHDYTGFYNQELPRRREAQFPPFGRLIRVTVSGPEKHRVEQHAEILVGHAQLALRRHPVGVAHVFGPHPAPIEKVRDRWRFNFLLRGSKAGVLRGILREALAALDAEKREGFSANRITIDVDPVDML
jgi:primosomal protein N' (replication factor Y)